MAQPSISGALERAGKFLLEDLWSAGLGGVPALRRGAIQTLRVVVLAVGGFRKDLCALRAAGLTFVTLMAFVPFLAVSFATLRGFGWKGERLEDLILERFTMMPPDATDRIVAYIDTTNVAGLGLLGGLVLFVTFMSVMSNIETSMNAIWGGAPPRKFLRRLTDYLAVMVAAPLLLVTATSLTAAKQSSGFLLWLSSFSGTSFVIAAGAWVAPYFLLWALFTFVYVFVPNTKVRVIPALFAGVVAGTVWELVGRTYIGFQFGMPHYNAIYGGLAQFPILMVWIYVSWLIVLAGAEVAATVQNLGVYSEERRQVSEGYALREFLGLSIVGELAGAAHARRRAPTIEELAARLEVPVRGVRSIVTDLCEGGIMHLGGVEQDLCFLSLAPSSISVVDVLDRLAGSNEEAGEIPEAANPRVAELLAELRRGRTAAVADASVADLVA